MHSIHYSIRMSSTVNLFHSQVMPSALMACILQQADTIRIASLSTTKMRHSKLPDFDVFLADFKRITSFIISEKKNIFFWWHIKCEQKPKKGYAMNRASMQCVQCPFGSLSTIMSNAKHWQTKIYASQWTHDVRAHHIDAYSHLYASTLLAKKSIKFFSLLLLNISIYGTLMEVGKNVSIARNSFTPNITCFVNPIVNRNSNSFYFFLHFFLFCYC